MRVFNVLRNSIYSLASLFLVGILTFAVRKCFVLYLPLELLGVEGLFSNILNMLSLAEMGVSSVIGYGLYRELAHKNEKEINVLMNIYRSIYAMIGVVVGIIGVILFFCLPWIVRHANVDWFYVQFVFVIQIGTALSSYFLAYRRTLFAADQKDFLSVRVDIFCSLASNAVKLCAIIFLHSYLLYAAVGLVFNVLANLIISHRVKVAYPFLHHVRVTWEEMRQRRFFTDIGNFLVHKICYVVYGTDMVIASSILGLRITALLANYALVQESVYKIMYKALQGIIPSIGNLIHEEDSKKVYLVFRMLDMIYSFIGSYTACIYMIVLQPFITLFFGAEYLLPTSYVITVAINVFLGMQFENVYNFRSTYGYYERDRSYMILSALAKLVLSIILSYKYGVTGIMIGTIIGFLFVAYGRIYIVFRFILKRPILPYLFHHLWNSTLVALEIALVTWVMSYLSLPTSYVGLIVSCILAVILMGVVQVLIFHRTEEFQALFVYAHSGVQALKARLHHVFHSKE